MTLILNNHSMISTKSNTVFAVALFTLGCIACSLAADEEKPTSTKWYENFYVSTSAEFNSDGDYGANLFDEDSYSGDPSESYISSKFSIGWMLTNRFSLEATLGKPRAATALSWRNFSPGATPDLNGEYADLLSVKVESKQLDISGIFEVPVDERLALQFSAGLTLFESKWSYDFNYTNWGFLPQGQFDEDRNEYLTIAVGSKIKVYRNIFLVVDHKYHFGSKDIPKRVAGLKIQVSFNPSHFKNL